MKSKRVLRYVDEVERRLLDHFREMIARERKRRRRLKSTHGDLALRVARLELFLEAELKFPGPGSTVHSDVSPKVMDPTDGPWTDRPVEKVRRD